MTKPADFTECVGDELPVGWEQAYDYQRGIYYVDHINSKRIFLYIINIFLYFMTKVLDKISIYSSTTWPRQLGWVIEIILHRENLLLMMYRQDIFIFLTFFHELQYIYT